MRHPAFRRPFHGVRTARDPIADSAGTRAVAEALAAEALPRLRLDHGETFSHTTALLLLGAPIRAEARDLHVTIPIPHGQNRTAGLIGHRTAAAHRGLLAGAAGGTEPVLIRAGGATLPCVPPALALLQSAPLLPFQELVVAADHLIRFWNDGRTPPIVPHDELIALVAAASGRGIRRLRAALLVARVGAESRMESLMHFDLASVGLDDLELQADLHDADGRRIGRFDEVDRKRLRILEYDGDQHRTDRRQYRKDRVRVQAAYDEGFRSLHLGMEDFRAGVREATTQRMCEFLGRSPRPVAAELRRYFENPWAS